MNERVSAVRAQRMWFCRLALLAGLVLIAQPAQGVDRTIGGAVYTNLANPLTSGVSGVILTVAGTGATGGTFLAATAGTQGLWEMTVPEGTYLVTPSRNATCFEHITGGESDGQTFATITVNEANLAVNQSIQFLASDATPTQLAFAVQPAGPYAGGEAISAAPQVAVQNARGITVSSFTGNVAIAIGNNPAGGALSGTVTRAAIAGVATFPGLSINKAGNGYTLQATSTGLTATISDAFNIIPDASSAHLVFTASPGNSPGLAALSPAPQVTVLDAMGNVVTAVHATITLAIKAGTGNAAATLSGTTSASLINGVATFSDVKINRAGTGYRLTAAADAGVTGTAESQAFNVTAQPQLTIAKADALDPVDPNDDVAYTITYGNEGLADATGVVIRETLPAGLEFVAASDSGVHSGGVITWNVADIPAETTGRTVNFVAHVTDALADGGTVTNSNLTIACNGVTAVGQETPETTTVTDGRAPQVSGQIPEPNSWDASLQPMIRLHVTDGGSGVAYAGGTVKIFIQRDLIGDAELIYDGAAEGPAGVYDSTGTGQYVRGVCRRTGTASDYTFTFLPTSQFTYEQLVTVTVEASDVAGNAGTTSYLFHTQLRSFGQNVKVNSDTGAAIQDNPAVATDSDGNIWVVWDQKATAASDTDVYIARLPADGNAFEPAALIFDSDLYQSNPAVAVDSTGRLYVVWEQWSASDPNRHILETNSSDGVHWETPGILNSIHGGTLEVCRNPSIAIDSGDVPYVAWEQTTNGVDSNIWVRSLSMNIPEMPLWQVTTDTADQTQPAVGVNAEDGVYVVWTDARNAATKGTDIYYASYAVGPWTNNKVVGSAANESSPAVATAEEDHVAWVSGGKLKYFFTGVAWDLVDTDETGALPAYPTLAAVPTDRGDKVCAAWADSRDVVNANGDTDIYFTESTSSVRWAGANILVNDDTGAHRQTKPAMGIDADGNPYLVWVDNRRGNDDIYYAGSTAVQSPFDTTVIPGEGGATTVQSATEANLRVRIPAGALPGGVAATDVSIAEVLNPPSPPTGGFGLAYSFGPSGVVFSSPVTLRIPLAADAPVYSVYTVYRHDGATGAWTQDGIHNPATKVTGVGGSYLEVQVDHFSTFTVGGSTPSGGGGGGGGGCALSPWSDAGPIDVLLPFVLCAGALLTYNAVHGLRHRSRRM